jgi:glycosyltransferase involved in cell wall biosynthesis
MERSSPDVSVIVPSFGVPPTLPGLLEGLASQSLDARRYEVLIVDPGTDGGFRRLERLVAGWDGPELRLLRGPLPGGPGARRNYGAARARGRLLAFTDSDCRPEPAWLEAGLTAHEAGAQLVQGTTLPPEGAVVPPFAHHHHISAPTALYESCNMFYERELFERVGGFTSRYFRRYRVPFGEDVDLGWRCVRAGASFRFAADARVRHAVVDRGVAAVLGYHWQARGFPLLVRDVPELRRSFFYRRLFLSRRSAEFFAAVAGLALAPRLPAATALGLPYARRLRGLPLRRVALELASDATISAALLQGSARWGRLVL